jgi:hypothetical protein
LTMKPIDPMEAWKRFKDESWELEETDDGPCSRLQTLYGFVGMLSKALMDIDGRIEKLERKKTRRKKKCAVKAKCSRS